MSWVTFAAIYFITWWICLFVVLPFNVKAQEERARHPASEKGAPEKANLPYKFLATTVLAFVIVALIWWGLSNPVLQEYWR